MRAAVQALLNDATYAQVHTVAFTDGEIRGQIETRRTNRTAITVPLDDVKAAKTARARLREGLLWQFCRGRR
jgi:hypothetical protein